jgi:hypothetical protein
MYGLFYCVVALALTAFAFEANGRSDVDLLVPMELLARSLAWSLPMLPLLAGRDLVYSLSSRFFDRDPESSQCDGTFIAVLLDSSDIFVGDVWWVHCGDALDRHQGLWRRGHVAEKTEDGFDVQLELPATKEEFHMSVRHSLGSDAGTLSMSSLHGVMIEKRGEGRRISGKVDLLTAHIPQPPLLMDWKDVFVNARTRLRCVEWSKLTPEILQRASVNRVEVHHLSRPVRRGEHIDFFVSHSWFDDEAAKFAQLAMVAGEFRARKKRDPVFWLDAACVDPHNDQDELRSLPVSLRASKRMLILCGDTFAKRLWAIWELFTLYTFCKVDFLDRLVLRSLDGETCDLGNRLQRFRIAQARCVDPNDERRVRNVIRELGDSRFNSRIQALGEALAACEIPTSIFGRLHAQTTTSVGQTEAEDDAGAESLPSSITATTRSRRSIDPSDLWGDDESVLAPSGCIQSPIPAIQEDAVPPPGLQE